MKKIPFVRSLMVAVCLLMAACATPGSPTTASPGAEATLPPQASPTPIELRVETVAETPAPTLEVTPDPVLYQPAINALAQMLALSPEEIVLREAETVEWPDASLGCPLEGEEYGQIPVPGFRVILEAGDQTYELHTGQEGRSVLCKDGRPALQTIDIPPGEEPTDNEPWVPVE
jgi:hypothetical protein